VNAIRRAIANGQPSFGVSQLWPGALVSETIGSVGFEWAFLDSQHGGLTNANLLESVQGLALGGTESVVRVGSGDDRLIGRALDCGAIGVVVPMVSTAEQARAAAAAVRYPPLGVRSFGPLRAMKPLDEANADALCLVMIETAEGLENLEAIISTPGVDGIYVGPIDLAISLGAPLDFTAMAPEVLEAIDAIVAGCERHGRIPGAFALGPENAEELLRRGVRLLTLGSDAIYFRRGAAADVERAKAWSREFTRHSDGCNQNGKERAT
jgi:4-hydroxy-2-oxoheptanedioate aldolase